MSAWLRSLLTSECIVELRRDRLRVRDLITGKEFEFAPILALDDQRRVLAVGGAPPGTVKIYEPFASAAALAAELLAAKVILQYAFEKLGRRWSLLRPAPRVLLHSPKQGPGAIDGVSDAALSELSQRAGAFRTIVHRGNALSSDEAWSRLRG